MKKYYKQIAAGYIWSIGTGGGFEISKEEYDNILSIIRNKPPKAGTTDYRLREDLTWEAYEVPSPSEDPDPDDVLDKAEAYDILMGVAP